MSVFRACPGGGSDDGIPIEEPIPLRFRLAADAIGEVMLILGADIELKDKFVETFEDKNCGVDTPTLIDDGAAFDITWDAILVGLGKDGALVIENPLIFYPPKNVLALINELN